MDCPACHNGRKDTPDALRVLFMVGCDFTMCDTGEYGVCYEVYDLGGRPGYSIIF